MREPFDQAMWEARSGATLAAGITALVIAPSFTVIGGLLTLLLLATAYPLFLIATYGVVGWRASLRIPAQATLPRWRMSLAIGGGVTLRLTLALLVTAAALALAVGIVFVIFSAIGSSNGESPFWALVAVLVLAASIVLAYLAGVVVVGLPCAWLGARLALRRQPAPTQAPWPK